ncbi:hypothetical protein G5I_12127 [Acromyrmex echinatior]|uniref:Uncharacterized protein n=1 Tax=Acromyrmex echinatior TaxID=103372 RepID=F4X1D0_ACREC|nr:hypothetical protein G5I_12127 [Acromyrmex echinatior]
MSRSFFSDESSIIGKYDKRAAPPTKGIGTVKNLTELTLQIRTYLAIDGPGEPPLSKRNRGNVEREKKNGGKRILLYSNGEKEKEDKWKKAKEEEGERLFCPSSIFLTMFISERRPHELAEIRMGPRNIVQRPETLRALDNFLEIVKSHFRDASTEKQTEDRLHLRPGKHFRRPSLSSRPSSPLDLRKVEKRSPSSPGGKLKGASYCVVRHYGPEMRETRRPVYVIQGKEEVERERKREKRDGRPTSSGNSSSAEFLISSRQPPPGEESGGDEGGGEGGSRERSRRNSRISSHRKLVVVVIVGGAGGGGGGSVFLITTAIFFSSRDDAAAKRYRNISAAPIIPLRPDYFYWLTFVDLHRVAQRSINGPCRFASDDEQRNAMGF